METFFFFFQSPAGRRRCCRTSTGILQAPKLPPLLSLPLQLSSQLKDLLMWYGNLN